MGSYFKRLRNGFFWRLQAFCLYGALDMSGSSINTDVCMYTVYMNAYMYIYAKTSVLQFLMITGAEGVITRLERKKATLMTPNAIIELVKRTDAV